MGHPWSDAPALELWGGLESTVNRVGDEYHDQIVASGHDRRPEDLDRIAALGVRALRYPVLWERTAPEGVASADWSWPDERLGRLRALGVRPIVGLVHHGSGPRHTNLLDPGFPEGLAAFAGAVAARYPWVDAYTPVNEPLTTARFSGLYGHWYPHGRDPLTFARALLTQCRAVVLAMRAVRAVNPQARLVQTDDLGKTFATPRLAYQADFDNERRWLTWDLLCGRIVPGHPMWEHLTWLGIPEQDLSWFAAHPCPPDVVGVNTYVTSERFLDHRAERYPPATRGGNGRDGYADVEAVRVLAGGLAGPGPLLREAWERYRLPVAVTEAHLGGTREEQLRWLLEVWHGAQDARAAGAEVVAVTAWSLLGAYDWDSLVTRPRGHYEPGVFDLRGPQPRPTALARLLPELAAGGEPSHPVLDGPGWWRRDRRLLYPPVHRAWPPHADTTRADTTRADTDAGVSGPIVAADRTGGGARPAPILIVGAGAGAALARAFARLCALRGLEHHRLGREELEDGGRTLPAPALAAAVESMLADLRPWAVVHVADSVALADPAGDDALRDEAARPRPHAEWAAILATACASRSLPLLTLSSDAVFDGHRSIPHSEGDPVAPLSAFGRSMAEAEGAVLVAHPSALVVRSGPRFGPWEARDPLVVALSRLSAGKPYVADDVTVLSPTYVPDLVDACLDLLVDGERGRWHLANPGPTTWFSLIDDVARRAGVDVDCLERHPAPAGSARTGDAPSAALTSSRGVLLPPLATTLDRFLYEARATGLLPWPARRIVGSRSSGAAA